MGGRGREGEAWVFWPVEEKLGTGRDAGKQPKMSPKSPGFGITKSEQEQK